MILKGIINTEGKEWASGCEACHFGLLIAPEPVGNFGLLENRHAQYKAGMLVFCECKAGVEYQKLLATYTQRASVNKAEDQTAEDNPLTQALPTFHYDGTGAWFNNE